MGGLQLVLSKTNRIGDTKYNICVVDTKTCLELPMDRQWAKLIGSRNSK